MLAGRLPFCFNELCTLHPPPRALQKGGTRESFFFSCPFAKQKVGLPRTQAPSQAWGDGASPGLRASPHLSPARSSVPTFNPWLLPKISSPRLCLHPAMGKPRVRVLEWCFSGVGTSRLHFYMSPTAPAGHGLLLGFDVNWGGSRQPRCTFKNPQLSNCLFYIMQQALQGQRRTCLMRF